MPPPAPTLAGGHGRPWPKGSGILTKRGDQDLGLLAEGRSNEQIVERLCSSRHTAKHFHLSTSLPSSASAAVPRAAAHAVRHFDTKDTNDSFLS